MDESATADMDIAREIVATANAADWLLFMAELGPKPSATLDLKGNWLLVCKHDLVATPPKLNARGLRIAHEVQRLRPQPAASFAINPHLDADAFKSAVEARLLELTARADPRLEKVRRAGLAAAANAHLEAVLLLKRFHAEGRIAAVAAEGVVIDDAFLIDVVLARLKPPS